MRRIFLETVKNLCLSSYNLFLMDWDWETLDGYIHGKRPIYQGGSLNKLS